MNFLKEIGARTLKKNKRENRMVTCSRVQKKPSLSDTVYLEQYDSPIVQGALFYWGTQKKWKCAQKSAPTMKMIFLSKDF